MHYLLSFSALNKIYDPVVYRGSETTYLGPFQKPVFQLQGFPI